MDLQEIQIKTEEETLELEDSNENYMKLDFEIGLKVENDSPAFDDWCLQNARSPPAPCEDVKTEYDVQTCFICFKMFANRYSLYKHNITHMAVVIEPQEFYQCHYCLCYFTSKLKIQHHIQMKHYTKIRTKRYTSKEDHKCFICNKVYTYKSWHGHMKEVHGSERMTCGKCNKTFKCFKYLRRHLMYVHDNRRRPSWRFRIAAQPEQEFNCELCPRIFQNRNSYKTHVRNCHSSEVHECQICHSKLKSNAYLLAHIKRVHYDDGKSHKCDICYKEFRSPRYLNVHKKNSHDVKVKSKVRQRKNSSESSKSIVSI